MEAHVLCKHEAQVRFLHSPFKYIGYMDRKDIDWDKIHSKEHKDFYGEDIKVGDRLLKPSYEYGIAVFDHCIVTRIETWKLLTQGKRVCSRGN